MPYAHNLEQVQHSVMWSWRPDCDIAEGPAALHGCSCVAGVLLPVVAPLAFGGNSVMYNTTVGALLLLISCSMHHVTRSDMRMGSLIDMHFALDDVCVVCCFYRCALTQEAIQLERMPEAADSHYNENDSDNARIRLPQGAYIESFLLARTAPIRPLFFLRRSCSWSYPSWHWLFMEVVERNEDKEGTRLQTYLCSIIREVEQQNKNAPPSPDPDALFGTRDPARVTRHA
jgi:hypothetical protein